MNTNTLPSADETPDVALGEDLASLACNAAIELDNLLIGQRPPLLAVRKLAYRLTKDLPIAPDAASGKFLVDPSTVVVMNRVIRESSWLGRPSQVQELTQAAGKVAKQLLAVSSDPNALADTGSLEQLRTFCLTLSRRAAASRGSAMETRPPHPFRKQG